METLPQEILLKIITNTDINISTISLINKNFRSIIGGNSIESREFFIKNYYRNHTRTANYFFLFVHTPIERVTL